MLQRLNPVLYCSYKGLTPILPRLRLSEVYLVLYCSYKGLTPEIHNLNCGLIQRFILFFIKD